MLPGMFSGIATASSEIAPSDPPHEALISGRSPALKGDQIVGAINDALATAGFSASEIESIRNFYQAGIDKIDDDNDKSRALLNGTLGKIFKKADIEKIDAALDALVDKVGKFVTRDVDATAAIDKGLSAAGFDAAEKEKLKDLFQVGVAQIDDKSDESRALLDSALDKVLDKADVEKVDAAIDALVGNLRKITSRDVDPSSNHGKIVASALQNFLEDAKRITTSKQAKMWFQKFQGLFPDNDVSVSEHCDCDKIIPAVEESIHDAVLNWDWYANWQKKHDPDETLDIKCFEPCMESKADKFVDEIKYFRKHDPPVDEPKVKNVTTIAGIVTAPGSVEKREESSENSFQVKRKIPLYQLLPEPVLVNVDGCDCKKTIESVKEPKPKDQSDYEWYPNWRAKYHPEGLNTTCITPCVDNAIKEFIYKVKKHQIFASFQPTLHPKIPHDAPNSPPRSKREETSEPSAEGGSKIPIIANEPPKSVETLSYRDWFTKIQKDGRFCTCAMEEKKSPKLMDWVLKFWPKHTQRCAKFCKATVGPWLEKEEKKGNSTGRPFFISPKPVTVPPPNDGDRSLRDQAESEQSA